MSARTMLAVTALAAGGFAAAFAAVAWLSPHPRLLWNASASVSIGLYRLRPLDAPAVGDLVAIRPDARLGRFMAERHYLPLGLPMLKHVAATSGATVCRRGMRVSVNGHRMAYALPHDRRGRPLPVWSGCRHLAPADIFLLNAAPDSMDGRYYGPLSTVGLLGLATPLLTRTTPGAPLVWRGWPAERAAKLPAATQRRCR